MLGWNWEFLKTNVHLSDLTDLFKLNSKTFSLYIALGGCKLLCCRVAWTSHKISQSPEESDMCLSLGEEILEAGKSIFNCTYWQSIDHVPSSAVEGFITPWRIRLIILTVLVCHRNAKLEDSDNAEVAGKPWKETCPRVQLQKMGWRCKSSLAGWEVPSL